MDAAFRLSMAMAAATAMTMARDANAAERVKLWPGGVPGVVAGKDTADDPAEPTIDIYLPRDVAAPGDTSAKRAGAAAPAAVSSAVVVFPGGGYGHLALGHEGRDVAEFLSGLGAAAFVVRYRHAPRYRHPIPLGDAKRAVRVVRSRAASWGIAPKAVGVLGFSAGGHLASTLLTHHDGGEPDAADPVDRASCRPDFGVLCYPVITFTREQFVHKGSRLNLLGGKPDPAVRAMLSSELQVTPNTPPCFLFHTSDDSAVPAENSVLFYLALRRAGVAAELHIFRPGAHGAGLAASDPVLGAWPGLLVNWMRCNGWLGRRATQPGREPSAASSHGGHEVVSAAAAAHNEMGGKMRRASQGRGAP